MMIHKVLRLYTTGDKFYVQPLGQENSDNRILEIDRVTQELSLKENQGQIPPRSAEIREIYGIIGILHLLAGPYLVVITKRKVVGLIENEEIWEMKEAEFIPFPKGTMHLTESQKLPRAVCKTPRIMLEENVKIYDNKVFLQMAQNALQTNGFYFSYTYDLTHSKQRLYNATPDFHQLPLHERADQRFVWNQHLLRLFVVQPELGPFTLPLMHGFVKICKTSIKQFSFDFVLISRRSCYRAGTRFNIRGVDDEGEVANFVETEQIIFYGGECCSFVQTRGSIPMYWSQYPTIRYKPNPQLTKDKNHNEGFKRHIDNQLVYYGKQTLVNLIDQKGGEKILGERFQMLSKTTGYSDIQLKYVAFDFHKQCSKMRWHRLQILMDELTDTINSMDYFRVNREQTILSFQNGVVRTNCMDCLDRTNVVQSLIARFILEKQLKVLGVIGENNKIVDFENFEFLFKNVWADNADMCAMQYTGTGALKTDYTRTGKRTKYGLIQDGVNSMLRYYKNNFTDGFRQDGIDLILGNYVVKPDDKFTNTKEWKYMTLPVILLFGFSMFLISFIIPETNFKLQLTYVVFWGVACVITAYFVILFGTEFVDKPRLANKRPKETK